MSNLKQTLTKKASDRLKTLKQRELGNDPAYKQQVKGRVKEYHKGVHDDIIQTKGKN